jgi:4-hydroxybenzoate polyprenyltransferase
MPTYAEYNVSHAIEAVASGLSIRKASLEWGVPRSTLQTRLHGVEPIRKTTAIQQRLSPTQEEHLATWIITQEALGVPPTHAQIKVFAERILRVSGDEGPLGKHWIQAFLKRHPGIKTKRQWPMDSKRINGATTQVITTWFDKFFLPTIRAIKP